MKTIPMRELTRELIALALPAHYEMTGGGCGTILIGDENNDGLVPYLIGPSDYYSATSFEGDPIVWSVEQGEVYHFANEVQFDTVQELAQIIANDYRREVGV